MVMSVAEERMSEAGRGDRGEVGAMTTGGCTSYLISIAPPRLELRMAYTNNSGRLCRLVALYDLFQVKEGELTPLRCDLFRSVSVSWNA